jgi:hypothetical protein
MGGWVNSTFDDFFELSSTVRVQWQDGFSALVPLSLVNVTEWAGAKTWIYQSEFFNSGFYRGTVKSVISISGSSLTVTLGVVDSSGYQVTGVSLRGSLASGRHTAVETVSENGLASGFVSHGIPGKNPVIGWSENEGDSVSISTNGDVIFTGRQVHAPGGSQTIYPGLKLVLLDHDPCSLASAVDLMKSEVGKQNGLWGGFSESPAYDSTCYRYQGDLPHAVQGSSVDLRLPFESSSDLDAWNGGSPFDDSVVDTRELGEVSGLPDGLSAEWYSDHSSMEAGIRIFGTPEISTEFTVQGFTYTQIGLEHSHPLLFSFSSSEPRIQEDEPDPDTVIDGNVNHETNPVTTAPGGTGLGPTAPAALLATTGVNVEWLLAAGFFAAIAGSVFLAVSRRKRVL